MGREYKFPLHHHTNPFLEGGFGVTRWRISVDLHLILPSLCMQEVPHPSAVQHRAVKQVDCYSRGKSECKYI